jgi:parallel beta-helix repeat protein
MFTTKSNAYLYPSNNNEVYSNNVENCENGIYLRSESSNNNIYNNTIKNTENGFLVNTGASDNKIHSNTIINATELDIKNDEGASDGNTFTENALINATLNSEDDEKDEEKEET